ncbi:UDP-2,4-diacetamido-2,4,6-trideoxy-beta-L-altropyranose hydrolase [Pokkaliibacter sp. MBI-7]|uniref:UDP-2,4-diacetamido-2,4, 6-trideoxy-beta-L-altropyranose hydrolase n=1 Tax=Pokkaliibacter sp. MBI-7 TaxID=3040600 RepID=UPI002447E5A2|nr:UDP-2,4-diacetamido-2,4,6-trideoxy-beta-L-altropyranose hydrolase [Pokkaliibacter sp. MBI-7]MDH2431303.1 UDP-2,4-diacetamido-2,4,6-trideoxy-beta-L-altropyranose hydrolase [Pokkaliibacter sp. MBI-7]
MRVLFRVDASDVIGGGHWLRCLVLAEEVLLQGGEVQWCYVSTAPALLQRLQHLDIPSSQLVVERAGAEDAQQTRDLAEQWGADWLIVDGYHFSADYRAQLRSLNYRLMVVDDLNDSGQMQADAVLNTTLYASELVYQPASLDVLAGADFVLLSRSYTQSHHVPFQQRTHLFVNFGASDAAGLTLPALQLLAASGINFPVMVVTGPAMRQHEQVAQLCQRHGFEHRHDVPSLYPVLNQCRLALTAAGSTLHELACLGVPSIFMVVADNQLRSAQAHQQHGWCIWFDGRSAGGLDDAVGMVKHWWEGVELDQRSEKARQLIDGMGAGRVVQYLRSEVQ